MLVNGGLSEKYHQRKDFTLKVSEYLKLLTILLRSNYYVYLVPDLNQEIKTEKISARDVSVGAVIVVTKCSFLPCVFRRVPSNTVSCI